MKSEVFLTGVIWFFVLIFFISLCLKVRRVKILPSLLIVFSITFFSLLSPVGEVLLSIASFRVTEDALLLGLRRSGILVGMVFLSRLIVSSRANDSNIARFGKLGEKLRDVFYWFNLLTAEKISLKRGHIIDSIDERLLVIWNSDK